jgi:hypothetical protein
VLKKERKRKNRNLNVIRKGVCWAGVGVLVIGLASAASELAYIRGILLIF